MHQDTASDQAALAPALAPSDVQVRLIRRKNQAALIEWHAPDTGYLHRAFVPYEQLKIMGSPDLADPMIFVSKPHEGVPYGVAWEELAELNIRVEPELLAHELRKAGIWTELDLRLNPQAALSAIQHVIGLSIHALAQAVRVQVKE